MTCRTPNCTNEYVPASDPKFCTRAKGVTSRVDGLCIPCRRAAKKAQAQKSRKGRMAFQSTPKNLTEEKSQQA